MAGRQGPQPFGQTILLTCFEPELVSLFMENGARADVERVRLFSMFMPNSIRGRPVEADIRKQCAWELNGRRPYAERCRLLSGLGNATPGTFPD